MGSIKELGSPGIPIGMLPDADFDDNSCEIQPGSNLYLFSDGVYEILQPDGNIWGLNAFIDLLNNYTKSNDGHLDTVLHQIQDLNKNKALDDDFSLLQINFD
jgi:sigma-B regulation protein RsbU (phosphoserine phosphatase)